ncbi:ABC-2 family transporter protein [Planctomycetaceae bacterium]|nr:ABC-2 family transporter protein [bacterium]MDC0273993.1 ABC-2 family transporter protein [Planctomycetaceae bacterium]
MTFSPDYLRVLLTFVRNALIREMTFRGNFLITMFTRAFWFAAQIILFEIIFREVSNIAEWTRAEYFGFMATGMLINSIVETFFMPNCANFSELIRTGNLDFVLLKPIDTQFLVSCEKLEIANLSQTVLSLALLVYAVINSGGVPDATMILSYIALVLIGVAFFYSLMISLASTSIWFGRNQGLYDFWFYITVFARYPRSIYTAQDTLAGNLLSTAFTYVIPILLVVTVPARVLMDKALDPSWLVFVGGGLTLIGLVVSRRIFQWSLLSYRSASS